MKSIVKLSLAVLSSGLLLSGISTAAVSTDETAPQNTSTSTTSQEQLQPGDNAIASELRSSLKEHAHIINVKVVNGVVYLSGVVPSDTDYEKIITKAESLKNITDVNAEKLTVAGSTQPLTDTYTTAKIKGLLIRKDLFDKDIPSWSINIETKNGTVYLSGEVRSEQEKNQVLDVVKSVDGIKGVDDQLKVAAADNGGVS